MYASRLASRSERRASPRLKEFPGGELVPWVQLGFVLSGGFKGEAVEPALEEVAGLLIDEVDEASLEARLRGM